MANNSSEDDLKKELTEMQFYVTQNHGTEPLLRAVCCITNAMAFTIAWCAMLRCSILKPSTILAAAGRVF